MFKSITLASDFFNVEYRIADFRAVFYSESKNHTHFIKSDHIFKLQALTLNE